MIVLVMHLVNADYLDRIRLYIDLERVECDL